MKPNMRRHSMMPALMIAAGLLAGPAAADDMLELALQETGQRDYYCTATFELAIPDGSAIQDINGFFYVFVDDEQVGRSKGSSFRFDGGTTQATATFETPNAPCTDVNRYEFVIGACMENNSFADRNECAGRIAPSDLVNEIRGR